MEPDGNPSISNADYRHVCWRVTLNSGGVYAIDLTGAQYGYYNPVCTWKECLDKRCLNFDSLRIGFRDDEEVAPLIAAEPGIPGFTPPNVDSYYATVRENFTGAMSAYLEGIDAAALLGPGGHRLGEVSRLLVEVRDQARTATMAADKVWNTFAWEEIPQDIADANMMAEWQNIRVRCA